jgi:hypothetical protein
MPKELLTRFQKIDIAFKIISSLAIVLTAFALLLNWYVLHEAHEWNRRQGTMTVLGNYTKDIGSTAKTIIVAYPGLYQRNLSGKLTPEDAQALYSATKEKDAERFTLRCAVIDYLNYMEYVCCCYENQTVDRETVKELYGGIFKRKRLTNYTVADFA